MCVLLEIRIFYAQNSHFTFFGGIANICFAINVYEIPELNAMHPVPPIRNSSASAGDITSEDTEDLSAAVQDAEICLLKSGELT